MFNRISLIFSVALLIFVFIVMIFKVFNKKNDASTNNVVVDSLSLNVKDKKEEYVLEIIGLGVTLDRYRQGALWDVLKSGSAYASIRDMDPKHYPWEALGKMNQSGSRATASMENAILDTPRYWGMPAFNAAPRYVGKDFEDRPEHPQAGIVGGLGDMHIFILTHRELSENPDRIVEKIFNFFDKNPSVPFVVLGSNDSAEVRINTKLPRKLFTDSYFVPPVPDASAVFVLARRERVDALRPFVFHDLEEPQPDVDRLNREGIARRVWLNYLELEKKVPLPPESDFGEVYRARQPTAAEWLADLDGFAKEFSMEQPGKFRFKLIETLKMHKPVLPPNWKPQPWFPVPWNTEQLEQFDRLPTLGFLHRPIFVKMTDAEGKPLKRAAERQAALHQGWKNALQTLPAEKRAEGPARVIVATNGNTTRLIDLHGMLDKIVEEGGPTFDPEQPQKFIDTDRRLGNTGAATFFMQAAIGVLGSYREGGVSAAVNLRDPYEASIVFISPPTDEQRKTQQHPIGGDVLRNATVPMIDPRNYEEPAMK